MPAVIALGVPTVTVLVIEHVFASVIVQVYVAAPRPVAVAAVPPLGAHEYVNVPVPPVALTAAEPFVPPLHDTDV